MAKVFLQIDMVLRKALALSHLLRLLAQSRVAQVSRQRITEKHLQSSLLGNDLHVDVARTWPVELAEENFLPSTKDKPSIFNEQ